MTVICARFRVGWLVLTPGAISAFLEAHDEPESFISRHLQGDWGDLGPNDWAANEEALRTGGRLLSAYRTSLGQVIWVITEANRYATTILLPEEY